MYKPITCILLLYLTYACKTAEDIRREKLVDEIHSNVQKDKEQLGQSQRMIADMTQELSEKKQQMFQLQGEIDLDRLKMKEMETQILKLSEDLKILDENTQMQYTELKKYLAEIVNGLKKIQKGQNASFSKAATNDNPLSLGLEHFKNGHFDKAKGLFLQVLKDPKLDKSIKNRVYHNLGIIEFNKNDCDQSMIYFTKIYTEDAQSVYAPNALLHIGKCFKKLNKPQESKAAFNQLISRYPSSSKVPSAQEELKTL